MNGHRMARPLQQAPTAFHLLLVEDEAAIAEPVRRGLEEEGYTVMLVRDGLSGLDEALAGSYDALIVDWRLPRLDGRTLVERVRESGSHVPVLLLTALRDVEYRVAGLDAGADDYLTKPFSFDELLARLRALLRRTASGPAVVAVHVRVGLLHLDSARRRVVVEDSGTEIPLRDKELRLLEVLMRQHGEVVTRTRIVEQVWGSALGVSDNALDLTASGLRQRMADAGGGGVHLETVRGVGYRLTTAR